MTAKESICSVAVGDGWIAIATNKQMLRLFSIGGVQREVISIPGRPVTVCGWGGRLAIVYQSGPCKMMSSTIIASSPSHSQFFIFCLRNKKLDVA